jgi:hypothetical protein
MKDMQKQNIIRQRLKKLSVFEKRKYGIPTDNNKIDILTGVTLFTLFNSLQEDNHPSFSEDSFSGKGAEYSGAGASDSWDNDSKTESNYDNSSSDNSSSNSVSGSD